MQLKILENMKKVAFLILTNVIGGHELQAVELVKLSKKYCLPTVFLNNEEHRSLFSDGCADIVVFEKPFFRKGQLPVQITDGFRNMWKHRKNFQKYDQIVVCAGTLEAGVSAGIALFGRPVDIYLPMFVDRTSIWTSLGILYNCLARACLLLFDRIITINKIQAKMLSSKPNTIILPNFVRLGTRARIDSPRSNKLFFIGRFDDQKKLPEMLMWLDQKPSGFNEMILIGDGPRRGEIEKVISGLRNLRVTCTGWLDKADQETMIQPSDILIMNSAYEGEPLVIREANERGNIVIVRDIPGVRGCTFKMNRFKSPEHLHRLLVAASCRNLSPYKKLNVTSLEVRRENAAKKLFL